MTIPGDENDWGDGVTRKPDPATGMGYILLGVCSVALVLGLLVTVAACVVLLGWA